MEVEIYSGTKPAVPRRAIFLTLALLVMSLLLAEGMVLQRRRTPLGPLVTPPNWGVSFRPPRGFNPGMPLMTSEGSVYPFFRAGGPAPDATLAVFRIDTESDDDPAGIAERILPNRTLLERYFGSPGPSGTTAAIGPRTAYEARDDKTNTVVRVVMGNTGHSFAVSLRVEDGPLDDDLYRLFEWTCSSFEFREP